MIDYKVAFREGQNAAKETENARKEIDSVFDKLNSEIAEASGGKIIIERRHLLDPEPSLQAISIITEIARTIFPHLAIAASNPTIHESPVKELARWSIDRKGYPCRISWDGQEHFCEDKEALEEALADLLREPSVGQKLYALMHLEAPKEETNGSADPEG